jgi:8-oxo-dGTP diphosphatase
VIHVTAAVIIEGGRVLIARRRPGARLGGKWEFPGGKIEPGESPEACLRRELKEELGIEAAIGGPLGRHVHAYDFGTVALTAFRVTDIHGPLCLNDHQEVHWATPASLSDFDFTPADLPFVAMIQSGEVKL